MAAASGATLVLSGSSAGGVGDSASAAAIFWLALVAAPLVAAWLVLEPWTGLLAWLVLMPLLNVDRASLSVGWVQFIYSTLAVAALAAGWLCDWRSSRARPSQLAAAAWAVTAAIVTLTAASSIAAGDMATSVPIALNGLVVPAVLAAVVVSRAPTRREVIMLLGAMAASVIIASAYNIFRLVRDVASLGAAQASRVDFSRFTYYNVGIFGDMLAMTLPFLIGLLVMARLERWRRGGWQVVAVGLAVVVVAAYLTFTKSAWLGCLFGGSLAALLLSVTVRQRIAVVIAAAIIAMFVVPYPVYVLRVASPALADAYQSFFTTIQGTDRAASWDPVTKEGEVSISERLLASEAGLRMAADFPLLGVGPGRFGAEYADGFKQASATRSLGSPHDFTVNLAAEYGLPVMLLVVGALVAAFGRAVRVFRQHGRDRPVAAALIGSLAAFAVVGTTFGVDLYRPWRFMDSDVIFLALIAAASLSLGAVRSVWAPVDGAGEASPEPMPTAPA